ncbi:pentatricopeptide repeat-containing protein At1g71490-like [Neltuma alba]|uniref:pentatricopeptide repeat-containing protein At1g71490-like n=1 Tax=Neltuma alba TaxID=207710 RepID=UPI0010A4FA00|nr:pentatricopeptide repeat-containing protein At1g71490-like isoform X2 [Prosopis alba]XP_028781381.1 pentatricopeptide repeat-containing protein At1g71490-like isoform X2 [Prosopis alba]XP_028794241.1 pentatricopeptide repeat-containing protein At1g71490-like [Prosopis alba]
MHLEYFLKSRAMRLLLVLLTLYYIPLALFFYLASTLNHCHRVSKFMSRLFHLVLINTPLWFLGSSLFNASVDLLADAQVAIEATNFLDPLPWNLLMSSNVRNGLFPEATSVSKKMMNKQVKPGNFTYPSVLKARGEALDCVAGVEIHKSIETSSLVWSLVVHNALVSMDGIN